MRSRASARVVGALRRSDQHRRDQRTIGRRGVRRSRRARRTRRTTAPTANCAPAGSTSTTRRIPLTSRRSASSSPRRCPVSSRVRRVPSFFSTVTGGRAGHSRFGRRLLVSQHPADRANSIRRCAAHARSGYRTFIESSPHPALIAGIEDTVQRLRRRRRRGDRRPHPGPRRRRAPAVPDVGRPGLCRRVSAWIGARVLPGARLCRAADVCL